MLTKEDYKKIADNWKGTVYQLYDRYQVRFPTLLKHLDVFKNKNVLEVGCNAGLAAYHIAQVANSYIGVEAEKDYWLQSLETKKLIESNNAEFLNMSIKSYMKRAIRDGIEISANACYLSYVLYHFSDKEVRMFEQNILPKLDVIIVQSRYAKRNKKGRRKHNSYGFWHPKNVENFLEKNGFKTTLEWGPDQKFHFIVGKKAAEKPLVTTMKTTMDMEKEIAEESAVITEDAYNALDELIKQETTDGDQGGSTVHRASTRTVSRRRRASGGSEQSNQGIARSDAKRRTPRERKSRVLQEEKQEVRD